MASAHLSGFTYWIFLVRGSVALALGAALLVSGAGLSLLASFLAGYWILGALVTLRWVVGHPGVSGRRFGALAAAIGLVAGILLFLREVLDALIEQGLLLDLIGAIAIAMGLLRLSGKFHDDQVAGEKPRGRYRLVIGMLDVVLGVAVIVANEDSVSQVRLALGVWGLLTGTFLLLDALRVRRLSHVAKQAEA